MPSPVRNRETFSQGAGYDMGAAWGTPTVDVGGSVDPDYPAQAWMNSIYPYHARVINTAGNGTTLGLAYNILTLPSTQDNDAMIIGYGCEAHTLGNSHASGSFIITDATATVIMFLCRLVTDGSGNLYFQIYSFATGTAVEVVGVSPLAYTTTLPLRFRFGVNINGPNLYTVSIDDGLLSASASVTDVPRQTTRMGLLVMGNTDRSGVIFSATQVYSYIQIGDVAAPARVSRLRSSVVPALATLIAMGHFFRRAASGLWLPTMRVPESPPLLGVA